MIADRMLALLVIALACTVPLSGCRRQAAPPPEAPPAEREAEEKSNDPFSESVRCEHEIPQYTCDECRYELGIVKVAPELLAEGAGPAGERLVPASAERRSLAGGRELPGEVKLDAGRSAWLSPRAPGVVRAIRVDLGDRVGAGEVLFEVESADLGEAEAEYRKWAAASALARSTAKREADLFERKICPEKDLLEANAALAEAEAGERAARDRMLRLGLSEAEVAGLDAVRARPGLLPVRAPFAGEILERSLHLGAQAEPGDPLLLVADTARVWVETRVFEGELAAILEARAKGVVEAEVVVPAYPGRTFRGTVEALAGTIDEATRTASARVVVANPEGLLRAGMFARVHLPLGAAEEVVAVPAEAVLEDEGSTFVFVRHDAEHWVRTPVTTGRRSDGWIEIAGGLAGGEIVMARGAFLLKSDVLRAKMGEGCAD